MMIDNIVESICAKWGDKIIRIVVTGPALDRTIQCKMVGSKSD
jgi:hypothetical protein